MFADYHVHTYYSDDSETPMEAQVERAISLGLCEICFTDHVDYGINVKKLGAYTCTPPISLH